jgi:DNA end-binding protein Ku
MNTPPIVSPEEWEAARQEIRAASGRAAIAKYVMRDKQHLGCLRVRDGVVTLEKMFFHDEIRPAKDIPAGGAKPAPSKPTAPMDLASDLAWV